MNNIFQRIDCNFIPVSNLQESIAWYVDVFGCTFSWEEETGYAALHVSIPSEGINKAHAMITLVEAEDFNSLCFYKNGEVHPYMNFFTKDIERAHQVLTDKGLKVEPIVDEGNLKFFNFFELNGHYMGVCSF